MNAELPDELRPLDDELRKALRDFAPPADLDATIVSHVSRRSRLSLLPTTRVGQGAAAAVAAGLLMTVGYVADRQINGRSSGLIGDLGRLVAFDSRDRAELPSAYYLHDDIQYFPAGPEFKLSKEAARQRGEAIEDRTRGLDVAVDRADADGDGRRDSEWWEASGQDGQKSDGRMKDSAGYVRPEGGESATSTLMMGSEVNSNAGLVGNVVIDEKNIGLDGLRHFRPGQVAVRDAGGGGGGQQGQNGGFVAEADGKNEPASGITTTKSRSSTDSDAPVPDPAVVAVDPPAAQAQAPQAVAVRQKVIRSGMVEFEVDSFDTAILTISKLVLENGGFVASTDSAKLPNGKTRGSVTLRLPPERLDTLVLMLRGIGDLKSQKISAQDVSKQYTDIESQLRAARAMQERLLEMIKTGKGAIKELLAAEKELGVWREKIEKLEGEIRYYDNLIGLSTLTVVIEERNIKASAASIEIETVSAGVETDDVEKARTEIIKAIDEAKGRIITSELKKLDAGQFSAMIVAEVAPDRAGPVVDRLKQLGKVARLDVDRKQTTVDGTAPPVAGAPVEKKPTRLTISLYNLANIAPRLTTSATLASGDVEEVYRKIMTLVEQAGGRVVTSQLQRPHPDQAQAMLHIEVPSAEAAKTQAEMAAMSAVMSMQVSENPDTANVTTAKQGFQLRIISAAGVPARQTTTATIRVASAESQQQVYLAKVTSLGGKIIDQTVSRDPNGRSSARVVFDVPRDEAGKILNDVRSAGEIWSMNTTTDPQAPDGALSRIRFDLQFSEREALVGAENGFWSSIKAGLATSLAGLGYSLRLLVVAVCLVAPWAAVLWGGWKLFRRTSKAGPSPTSVDA
jgi:glycine cleavage system regulatory protein